MKNNLKVLVALLVKGIDTVEIIKVLSDVKKRK